MVSLLESTERGVGLYSTKEVAYYLGVHPSTLKSWLSADNHGESLFSFHDFIQAFAIKALKDIGLKPKRVREAINEATGGFRFPYPLSVEGHAVYVDNNQRVYIRWSSDSVPEDFSGKRTRLRMIRRLAEPYMDRVEFDSSGMAERFIVFEKLFGETKRRIVMEPSVNFGEPTVEGTPYRAETLVRAVKAEGGVAAVAAIYEIEVSEVLVALEAGSDGDSRVAA